MAAAQNARSWSILRMDAPDKRRRGREILEAWYFFTSTSLALAIATWPVAGCSVAKKNRDWTNKEPTNQQMINLNAVGVFRFFLA